MSTSGSQEAGADPADGLRLPVALDKRGKLVELGGSRHETVICEDFEIFLSCEGRFFEPRADLADGVAKDAWRQV